ncbi:MULTISPECIES: hypothetical protein [unclassified Sphingomonas]|uniref:hypothetical protein n=1 Tax=unclassified Sphingomonas TaxID=196159 RepID=UPI0012E2511A|nr:MULTISPECIES: hypothetical protein [unclassified Sphingomonas]
MQPSLTARLPWWRIVSILILGVPLLWLSLAISLDGIAARSRPEQVLRWWPWSARAAAARSAALITDPAFPRNIAEVRAAASASLDRQALSPVAARSLALAAAQRPNGLDRAQRLMRYGEALTRHDLQTQLWLIETSVQQGRIDQALIHYDRALRTSPDSRGLLLPIMVAAVNEPTIARSLTGLLAARPSWRYAFADRLVVEGGNPETIAILLPALGLSPNVEFDRRLIGNGLARMVELGSARKAYALYQRMGGQPITTANRVNNGNFARDAGLRPFDWWMATDNGLVASREPDEKQGYRMRVSIAAGASGTLARQLVLVEPGSYALRARVAGETEENSKVALRLTCTGGTRLFDRPRDANGIVTGTVTVPAGCDAAWLSFEASGALDGPPDDYLIQDVSLTRQ